jgi:DNA replication and repair protein RecF
VHIESIRLKSFRNYSDREIYPSPGLTVLIGINASGKTNVIEAVQIVTSGRSFRRPKWDEVIKWDEDSAMISANLSSATTSSKVEVVIKRGAQRTFRLNGLAKKRVSDVAGILPVVVFTPDDLDLSKGSAEVRRMEVDDLGEQLSKTYGAVRRDYNKVVRHRNVLLREWQASDIDLEPWDVQLASLGSKLLVHRRRLLRKIAERAKESYQELSQDEGLTIHYLDRCGLSTSCLDEEIQIELAEKTIFSTLENRRDEERARRTTLVGPHRDEIIFRLGDRDARAFASQGQQRTIALAWKLAEVDVVEDVAHKKPVLLLDDVMSELDENRRRALTGLVQRNIQTFITTTEEAHFDPELLAEALVINAGDM